jgi:flagellar protein FlaJ
MILYLLLKKEEFRKILRGAMLRVSPEIYSICSVLFALTGLLFALIIYSFVSNVILFTLPLLFYLFSITYPFIRLKSRKAKIDLKLPHAIVYMQSLSKSMPLFEIFKSIFLEKELYGEVSEEFGFIVRDVELFGENLLNAIKNLADSTPSENLKELLEGLILVFETGNFQEYFSTKSSHFRNKAKKQLEIHLKTLEILAEVFVVVFVAMPVFLIVMVSTMGLMGKAVSYEYFIYLYVFIPVGSMLLIYVIDLMNVKEDLSVTKLERKKLFYPVSIISGSGEFKKVEKREIKEIISFPFKAVKNIYFSFLAFAIFALFWNFNRLQMKFPESFVSLSIIFSCIPLLLAFEYRARYVRKVEKEIPELLREILNLKDVGLTLQGVINMLKESKIGVLSRELKMVSADIHFGATVIDALVEFINRTGVSSIRRAISLIVKASTTTENLRDILLTSIEDFEYELRMKSDRFTAGFAYLVVVYVSFFTFLYTAYVMHSSFLAALPTEVNLDLSLIYRTSLILALFSGIIAGQMEKGSILNGLKHICIFVSASFILFEYVMGGSL